MVVAHEQAHLARHDPQVLGAALFLLVLMPWNLPLWWQLHRLRGAIEVDCDKRVLNGARDTEQYRQMLLDVSQRPSAYVGLGAPPSSSVIKMTYAIQVSTASHLSCNFSASSLRMRRISSGLRLRSDTSRANNTSEESLKNLAIRCLSALFCAACRCTVAK